MLEKKEYGKPISKELSTVLRRNAGKEDIANVAATTGISFSTIRDVIYRTNSLTESNSRAIKSLLNIAFQNSLARQLQAEGDKIFLNRILRN